MILVCGEALIDLVPRAFGAETAYVPVPGGSPFNVAVGLGRLQVPTGFLGRMSRDAFGRRLRAHLAASGVDIALCPEGTELSTLAVVHLTPGQEPEFAFYGDGTADVRFLPAELPAGAAGGRHGAPLRVDLAAPGAGRVHLRGAAWSGSTAGGS